MNPDRERPGQSRFTFLQQELFAVELEQVVSVQELCSLELPAVVVFEVASCSLVTISFLDRGERSWNIPGDSSRIPLYAFS